MYYTKNIIGSIFTFATLVLIFASVTTFSGIAFAVESDPPPVLELELPPFLGAPPESEEDDDENNDDEIQIIEHKADPVGFNPTAAFTEVVYKISKDAQIEIKILNRNEETVIKLVDDAQKDAGEHRVKWYGREANTSDGNIVPAGEYKYKILAKNPSTEAVEDTAEGDINVIHTPDDDASDDDDDDDDDGVMIVTNAISGQTVETGPGVLIYLLFPLAGYLVARKRK